MNFSGAISARDNKGWHALAVLAAARVGCTRKNAMASVAAWAEWVAVIVAGLLLTVGFALLRLVRAIQKAAGCSPPRSSAAGDRLHLPLCTKDDDDATTKEYGESCRGCKAV